MGYVIGIDEAGYGPNFGPLVVSASVWEVPGDPRRFDFWKSLRGVVVRTLRGSVPSRASARGGRVGARPLLWNDSKKVYSPAAGLAALERGTLAAVHQLSGGVPAALSDFCGTVVGGPPADPPIWLDGDDPRLPRAADGAEVAAAAGRLARRLRSVGVRPVGLWSEVVFEGRFNALVAEHGNKANLLSAISLALLARAWQLCPADEPVLAVLDHHGGRRSYGPMVQEALGERFVWCLEETAARSRYREAPGVRSGSTVEGREGVGTARPGFPPPQPSPTRGEGVSAAEREIRFEVGAERHLPVALASMTSKYLRELYMELFNAFWARQVEGLRPTAGYATDAYRFRDEIREAQQRLGIPDALIWRAC